LEKLIAIVQNLVYITDLAETLPFFLCLIFHKKIVTKELKVFFVYTILFIFSLSLLLVSIHILKSSSFTLLVIRGIIVTEFSLLSLFYFYIIKNKNKKIVFICATIIFIIYSIYDYYISIGSDFSYIPLVIECLFFLFVILYYFYEKMQYSVTTPIYQSPDFWISVAFLVYFSGNFFLFLYTKTMSSDPQFKDLYNVIYDSFTIIKDVLLCTAIFVNNHREKEAVHYNIPISFDLDGFKPIKNNY
jgi:hypothetical protein